LLEEPLKVLGLSKDGSRIFAVGPARLTVVDAKTGTLRDDFAVGERRYALR
jgi:hypothetical protein